MKVVFLDVDGVLNYHKMPKNRPLDGSAWFRDKVAWICPHRVKLLNSIHAKFVLSSAWRYSVKVEVMQRMLAYRGFVGQLIGSTPTAMCLKGTYKGEDPPNGYHVSPPRGHEIAEWLDENHAYVDQFVIVDDNSDMAHLSHRLVQTDPLVGLTQKNVDKIKEMLNG